MKWKIVVKYKDWCDGIFLKGLNYYKCQMEGPEERLKLERQGKKRKTYFRRGQGKIL